MFGSILPLDFVFFVIQTHMQSRESTHECADLLAYMLAAEWARIGANRRCAGLTGHVRAR